MKNKNHKTARSYTKIGPAVAPVFLGLGSRIAVNPQSPGDAHSDRMCRGFISAFCQIFHDIDW
jgi:hypothetical protein